MPAYKQNSSQGRYHALYVLTDGGTFQTAYLLNGWAKLLRECAGSRVATGIMLRGETKANFSKKLAFHECHAGKTQLTGAEREELEGLYAPLVPIEEAMIQRLGIPPLPKNLLDRVLYFKTKLNTTRAYERLHAEIQRVGPMVILTYLDCMLKGDWLTSPQAILNTHPGVLPYARGINAIEQMALKAHQEGAPELFLESVGATVHYIDAGVDTGPIIRAERLQEPLNYTCLASLKADVYQLGYRMLLDEARHLLMRPRSLPAGVVPNPALLGPNFLRKNFRPTECEVAFAQLMEVNADSNARADGAGMDM